MARTSASDPCCSAAESRRRRGEGPRAFPGSPSARGRRRTSSCWASAPSPPPRGSWARPAGGEADRFREGQEVALVDGETGELMGTLTVREKYTIDRAHECKQVFRTTDPAHPGVATVMGQGEVNLAGPVRVLSEGQYPVQYPGLYMRPAEA